MAQSLALFHHSANETLSTTVLAMGIRCTTQNANPFGLKQLPELRRSKVKIPN